MKNRIVLLATGMILIFVVSTLSQTMTKEIENQVSHEIKEQWGFALKLINNLDVEGALNLFSETDFDGDILNGRVIWPRDKFVEQLHKWFGSRESQHYEPSFLNVKVLTNDLAILDVVGEFTMVGKDGTITKVIHGMSYIYKREPVGWRIIHMHESNRKI